MGWTGRGRRMRPERASSDGRGLRAENAPDRLRLARDELEVGERHGVGMDPPLLPILKPAKIDLELAREFALRQPEPLSEQPDVSPEDAALQLLFARGGIVGVGPGVLLDLFGG